MTRKEGETGKKMIAFFDFDHTVSKRDSFLDFLLFTFPRMKLLRGFVFLFPALFLYKLGMIPNWRAKEITLGYFFGGMKVEKFRGMASFYSRTALPRIVKPEALERIKWHKEKGHRVFVVSASLRAWLEHWCRLNRLELICTETDYTKDCINGYLKTINCWGPEKVRRINKAVSLDEYDYIYAYGDSAGDTQMLELADEAYYNWKLI